ncbi:myosin heavy chain kinase A-like [Oculina patagonica]
MSKRGRRTNDEFRAFKAKIAKKRMGKDESTGSGDMDYITVQRLSSNVEGRYQKYARIGALTMVPLGCEPTISNIKEACKRFFKAEHMECDILAGERGPSWTESSQITNWKAIHVRFIEKSDGESEMSELESVRETKSQLTPEKPARPMATKAAASVPLSAMLKVGKLIQPTADIVSVQLEEFDLGEKSWRQPCEAKFSLLKQKFASGAFRDAYHATALSELSPGKYVLKKFKEDQVQEIERLFTSMETHTRKVVQMNALARNFALRLAAEAPVKYGSTLRYTKVYFGKLYGQCVTVEPYIEGAFEKHVNNTGEVCGDGGEVSCKAETFSHYTYCKSGKQLMVVDIQGVDYTLFDPEIATSELLDNADQSIFFCCGNLSSQAIEKFKTEHICNKFCDLLKLDKL